MDEAGVRAQPGDAPEPHVAPGEASRMEALEYEVRLLTSRLAGWVEAQFVQALDDRRQEMKALRSELQFTMNEQLAALQAAPAAGEALEQRVRAAMSRLSDSVEARIAAEADNRRAELEALRTSVEAAVAAQSSKAEATLAAMQDLSGTSSTLGARLDEVAGQAAAAAQQSAAIRAAADAVPERIEAFEQRVKAAMGRLTDSFETRLAEVAAGRDPAVDELRSLIRAGAARVDALDDQVQALRSESDADRQSLRDRLDSLSARLTSLTDSMGAIQDEIDAGPRRTELLEQRVRSAVGRLAESVETRLSEAESARTAEVAALRSELDTAVAALRARSSQVQERLDAVEALHRDAGERLGQMAETTLGEVLDGRRAEMEQLRRELEDALAIQLREGRTEIGTAVADAHRRFVVSVDRLEEQMHVVTEQAAAAQAAVARVELVPEAVASDGRRIEALEEHTRRTDARLGDLVDDKLAELAAARLAEVDGVRVELRTALDTHLAEIRAEVATSLVESRTETATATTRLEERLTALDTLGRTIEASQREAEERLEHALQERLTALDAALADATAGRAEMVKAVASLDRKTARAREKVDQKIGGLAEQVDALVKAAAAEGGALAPIRSDLRLLQSQVAELAETVAELRPRRKAPAPATKAPAKKAAPATKGTAKKAATPATKAAARKVATPAKTAAARRRIQ